MSKETEIKDGVEPDNLIRPPFTRKYLDSEKEETSGEFLTLRLNPEERRMLNELKRCLNYGQDAKVVKVGLVVLRNVIHGSFGEALMGKLTDPNRRRVIFEDTKEEGRPENL